MIDWTRVNDLKSEVGAEDFEEIVEIFLEEVGETLLANQGGMSPGSEEETMHFLKGSAMNIGFADLATLCADGELAAREGRTQDIDLGKVAACYEASKSALLARLEAA